MASGIRLSWTAPNEQVAYFREFRRWTGLGEGKLFNFSVELPGHSTIFADEAVNIVNEVYEYPVRGFRDRTRSDCS